MIPRTITRIKTVTSLPNPPAISRPSIRQKTKPAKVKQQKREPTTWERRQKTLEKALTYFLLKVESAAWVCAAVFSLWYSNFFKQLMEHPDVIGVFRDLFMLTLGINIILCIFVAFILPFRGLDPEELYGKKLYNIGALSGFIGFVSLAVAVWPVYHLWTLPLLFVFFMGFLMSADFMPSGHIGSVMFALVFMGGLCSFYFIEHEGYLHRKAE